jgi:hypothetical protein
MAVTLVNFELLLSRRVLSCDGKNVGHIEEIKIERRGNELVVVEYHLGARAALLERLSASTIGIAILNLFGWQGRGEARRVPWDKLDLSDPAHPRLLSDVSELAPLEK